MPRRQQPKKTWRYSDEFKVNAVALSYEEGVQVREVAHSLDIHPFMLSRWRKQYRDGTIKADRRKRIGLVTKKKPPKVRKPTELEKLRKENERLQKEVDFLKKWQRYLAERHQSDLDSSKPTDEN